MSEPSKEPGRERRAPAEAVAWSLRVTSEWCIRLLIVGLTLFLLAKAYERVHLVAVSFMIGLLLAAVLRPLFNLLRIRAHLPRALAALLSVLLAVVALAAVAYFVVDQITSNVAELSSQLQRSVDSISHWLTTGPLHLKQSDLDGLSTRITNAIKNNQSQIASGALSTAMSVAEGLSGALLVILTSFFLVKDGEKIWTWLLSMLPTAARTPVNEAGQRSWITLGGYIRGQVSIALFHAVTITITLLLCRVPLAAPLGALVFIGSFIPLFGMIIAGGLCTLIALLERGPLIAIIVLVIVIILVQAESHVLQPLIMSRAVEIHPLAVAIAVIAGTKLDGIAGALFAVPFVSVANTALRSLHGSVSTGPPEGLRAGRLSAIKVPQVKRRRIPADVATPDLSSSRPVDSSDSATDPH